MTAVTLTPKQLTTLHRLSNRASHVALEPVDFGRAVQVVAYFQGEPTAPMTLYGSGVLVTADGEEIRNVVGFSENLGRVNPTTGRPVGV